MDLARIIPKISIKAANELHMQTASFMISLHGYLDADGQAQVTL